VRPAQEHPIDEQARRRQRPTAHAAIECCRTGVVPATTDIRRLPAARPDTPMLMLVITYFVPVHADIEF